MEQNNLQSQLQSNFQPPNQNNWFQNLIQKRMAQLKNPSYLIVAVILIVAGIAFGYFYTAKQEKAMKDKINEETQNLLQQQQGISGGAQYGLPELQPSTGGAMSGQQAPIDGGQTGTAPLNQQSSQTPLAPAQQSGQTQQPALGAIKTINNNSVPMQRISTNNCVAYAPAGWSNVENPAVYAFGYDSYNADRSMGASYLVNAVTVDPYSNYYRNATPEQFVETTMTALQNYTNFSWIGGPWNLGGGYTVRLWRALDPSGYEVKAVAQWATWPLNDGTPNYVIALRMGAARANYWNQGYAAVVYDVATSIRCSAQVRQSSGVGSNASSEDSFSQRGSSDDNLSEARREATMGYENVYDAQTGEHYEAPLSSYNTVGPYGGDPGYYKQVGNDYIKLEKGFGF